MRNLDRSMPRFFLRAAVIIVSAAIFASGALPAYAAKEFHLGESTGNSRLSDKPTKFLDVPNKGVPERPPFF